MDQTLALVVSIVLVLILIRKLNIGISLFVGSAVLSYLLFGFYGFEVMLNALVSLQTIKIVIIVILAFTLGYAMEYFGMLGEIAESLSESIGAYSFILIPLLIGLLPMPGGALISAVMLGPLVKKYALSPEKATLLNYWFRHIWVTFWPLYPSIIIGSAVLNTDLFKFASATFPISIFAVISGLLLTRGMERKFRIGKDTAKALLNLYPVAILILLTVAMKIDLLVSLLVSIAAVSIHRRAKIRDFEKIMKKTVDRKIIILVFAVMVFKSVIEVSGAAESLFTDISLEFPAPIAAFILTLTVGFATGIEMSYSSIALPLLTSFTGVGNIIPHNLMLVIAAGYIGVMLSPLHLCYVLTAEYFGTEVSRTYRQLFVIAFITAMLVWILYLL
ncbi:TIGR00529 family membrane protein [Archaeoglobus neptunius]|uniref:TIGR00529 family membrane protein n=1 Tax=Archaeoglobus neptunius TaxID=2798580 RepID=UPI00192770AC|nr:TIGR00529 family membrane protein [Archaeoglobus neptunius]